MRNGNQLETTETTVEIGAELSLAIPFTQSTDQLL
jgi:hypothetical protein